MRQRSESIHQIRITLNGSKPPVWRKLAVPSDITLGRLHEVIQIAMGWTNSHMHQFILRGEKRKPARRKPPESEGTCVEKAIDLPDGRKGYMLSTNPLEDSDTSISAQCDMSWFDTGDRYYVTKVTPWGDPTDIDGEDEEAVTLAEVCPNLKSTLIYEYDFGDSWEHTIEVQKIEVADKGVTYPVCLAGKQACPPEDCGGLWGYYDLLDGLADPDHEMHEDAVEFFEEGLGPVAFDLEEVNSIMDEWRKG